MSVWSRAQEYDQLTAQQKEIEEKLQELESSLPRFNLFQNIHCLSYRIEEMQQWTV